MNGQVLITVIAIICITLMELVAMIFLHLDGVVLSASVGIVATLGGISFKTWKRQNSEEMGGGVHG